MIENISVFVAHALWTLWPVIAIFCAFAFPR